MTVSCRSKMVIMTSSPVMGRTRSNSPRNTSAAATPSPYPAGNQSDVQNEQEDLGTKLEGKFDGVSDGDDPKGKATKKKGNKNTEKYYPCKVVVKAAGGKKLLVLGKVFMELDFGQGVKFKTVFVIVKDLGVPALLGTNTMARVGIDICFTSPRRIECLTPKTDVRAIFPLKMGCRTTSVRAAQVAPWVPLRHHGSGMVP